MSRRAYPTDLTDAEWAILAPLVPPSQPGGRPPAHARHELINAMLYVLRGGIAWRAMLHDLPPWQSVYHYFRLWRLDGTWEHINAALREAWGLPGHDPADARPNGPIMAL